MLLFYLVLTLVDSLLIATVGRQIPSSTCFLMDTLNFEKISGYLLQNPLTCTPLNLLHIHTHMHSHNSNYLRGSVIRCAQHFSGIRLWHTGHIRNTGSTPSRGKHINRIEIGKCRPEEKCWIKGQLFQCCIDLVIS